MAKPKNTRKRKPPNLRQAEQAEHRACASCEWYAKNNCSRWNWTVKPYQVCDTWTERQPEDLSKRDKRLQQGMAVTGGTVIVVEPGGAGA